MWGDAAWQKRQQEREEHEAKIDAEQWAKGTELEDLLVKANTDPYTARLVQLARIIRPEDFKMREEGLERIREMRLGRQGNDPDFQKVIRVHERTVRLSIEYAISKARDVMTYVETWDKNDA